MHLRNAFHVLCVASACATLAPTLSAQQQESQLKAYAEFALANASYSGNLSRIDPGMGVNVAAVITTEQPLFFGIGIRYTKHSTTDMPDKLGMLETYVEPRFQLVRHGKFIPFVGVRISYARASQTQTLTDDRGNTLTGATVQTGPGLGLSAILLYRASQHMRAYINVSGERIKFGDLDFELSRVNGSSVSGTSIGAQLGLSLDFALEAEQFRGFFRR